MPFNAAEVEHLHRKACRHCCAKEATLDDATRLIFERPTDPAATPPIQTYGLVCSGGGARLAQSLLAIEKHPKPVNGVSTFCERCCKISVISFEYYRHAIAGVDGGCMFLDCAVREFEPVVRPYTDAWSYYTHLVSVFETRDRFP